MVHIRSENLPFLWIAPEEVQQLHDQSKRMSLQEGNVLHGKIWVTYQSKKILLSNLAEKIHKHNVWEYKKEMAV